MHYSFNIVLLNISFHSPSDKMLAVVSDTKENCWHFATYGVYRAVQRGNKPLNHLVHAGQVGIMG